MKSLRLILLALRYHWDAQKSNPANLLAGTFGMIINNVIVLWGLWAMLFNGKPGAEQLTIYFLSLNAMVTIGWGAVCYFLGGIRALGEYIEDGALEPMLATPRDPLLLASISRCMVPVLGDLIQGACNLVALFFLAPAATAFHCVVFTLVSAVAFLGLFIFVGAIPFFVKRGSALGQLLLEVNLSLAFYPMGKVFTGQGRILLYLTPAALAGALPMDAIEGGSLVTSLLSVASAFLFFWLAVQVFRLGLRRYQSASYVTVRG